MTLSLGAIVLSQMQAMEAVINRQAEVIRRMEGQVDELEDHVNNLRLMTLDLWDRVRGD